ncbi:MAG: hypothetical protein R2932_48455 [Caldilineaceae bacterium]
MKSIRHVVTLFVLALALAPPAWAQQDHSVGEEVKAGMPGYCVIHMFPLVTEMVQGDDIEVDRIFLKRIFNIDHSEQQRVILTGEPETGDILANDEMVVDVRYIRYFRPPDQSWQHDFRTGTDGALAPLPAQEITHLLQVGRNYLGLDVFNREGSSAAMSPLFVWIFEPCTVEPTATATAVPPTSTATATSIPTSTETPMPISTAVPTATIQVTATKAPTVALPNTDRASDAPNMMEDRQFLPPYGLLVLIAVGIGYAARRVYRRK